MRPVAEWDEGDLQRLIDAETEEGTGIDFKSGAGLAKNPKRNGEMCKDASAMANAAGGVIVYGIAERDRGGPDRVGIADHLEGCDPALITKDTIEQILSNGIEPRLRGVEVKRVSLSDGRVAFAIHVPQATALAPHQSREHKQYFRRYNAEALPMLDHEIRDLIRRGEKPEPFLTFEFGYMAREADGYAMQVYYGNHSSEPALYSYLTVSLIDQLTQTIDNLRHDWSVVYSEPGLDHQGRRSRTFIKWFSVDKGDPPAFKELPGQIVLSVNVIIQAGIRYPLSYRASAPGRSAERIGYVFRPVGGTPEAVFPNGAERAA